MRRGYNYVANPRIPIPEKRRNPPQENRVRFERTDNPKIPRVPRQPTHNVIVMDDAYDEHLIEQENYYSPDESYETVQMDRCKMSMYIFEEGDKDPNSQESVAQTRGFVNRQKNKGNFDKDNQKEKEKEKKNEKVTDIIGSKRKHLTSNALK
jgi:hypothetical protein